MAFSKIKAIILSLVLASTLYMTACDDFNEPLVPFIDHSTGLVAGENWRISTPYCGTSCEGHPGKITIEPGVDAVITISLRNLHGYDDVSVVFASTGTDIDETGKAEIIESDNVVTITINNPQREDVFDLDLIVTANDGKRTSIYDMPTVQALHLNANLKFLKTDKGYIAETFSSEKTDYTLVISAAEKNVGIIAEADDKDYATVAVTGNDPISRTITVQVRADCGRPKYYYINVQTQALYIPSLVTIPGAVYKYISQSPTSITVTNSGVGSVTISKIELSGDNKDLFSLDTTYALIALNENDTASFTITPKTGLDAGTYTATVTVSGSNNTETSFTVSFTVDKADPTVTTWPKDFKAWVDDTISTWTNGSSVTAGSFSWSDDTFDTSGSHEITVTFSPTDTTNYKTITNTATVKAIPINAIKMVYMGKGLVLVQNAVSNLMSQAPAGTTMIRAGGTKSGDDPEDYGDLNDDTTRFPYLNPYYIILGFTQITSLYDNPVTNIYGTTGGKDPDSLITVGGIIYYHFGVDTNDGAGGDYTYFYYTTDERAGKPITDMYVGIDGDYPSGTGWTRINQNTNSGTGCDSIYIYVKR